MSRFQSPFGPSQPFPLEYGQRLEAGVLARFFNIVYAWMAAGLAVTAVVSWWVSQQPQILAAMGLGAFVALFVVEVLLVGVIAAAVRRINATVATVLFILYAALNGVTLGGLFLYYAHATIASAFVITAGMFAASSLFGFVTRRDLTSLGGFLFMGLIGIVIASVVSIFWHPTMLVVLINYLGAFIFVGLAAFETQRLKWIALQTQNDYALASRLAISGALTLYLDFLNLFLFLLNILSNNGRER